MAGQFPSPAFLHPWPLRESYTLLPVGEYLFPSLGKSRFLTDFFPVRENLGFFRVFPFEELRENPGLLLRVFLSHIAIIYVEIAVLF